MMYTKSFKKRSILFLAFVFLCQLRLYAQDIQITQFERNPTNLVASMYPEYDNTGTACAVIRFLVRDTGFIIQGNLGIVKQDSLPGEIRIWVPQGTKRITVRNNRYMPLDGYEIPIKIESKMVYDAIIEAKTFIDDNSPQKKFLGVFNRLFANLSFGSEGLSIGLSTPISPYVDLMAGINFMPGIKIHDDVDITTENVEINNLQTQQTDVYNFDKLDVVGNLARTTFDIKLCIYPGGYRFPLYLCGGVSFGGEKIATSEGYSSEVARIYREHPEYTGKIEARFSEINVDIDHNGYVYGDAIVKKVRPYFGLGYGRLSTNKRRFDFRIEAGFQSMGKIHLYQNNRLIDKSIADLIDGFLPQVIDKINIYPVLKFSLIYRII